jgi:hypothetical protein
MNTLELLDQLTDRVRAEVADLKLVNEVLDRLPEAAETTNLPAYVRVQALVSAFVQLKGRLLDATLG